MTGVDGNIISAVRRPLKNDIDDLRLAISKKITLFYPIENDSFLRKDIKVFKKRTIFIFKCFFLVIFF